MTVPTSSAELNYKPASAGTAHSRQFSCQGATMRVKRKWRRTRGETCAANRRGCRRGGVLACRCHSILLSLHGSVDGDINQSADSELSRAAAGRVKSVPDVRTVRCFEFRRGLRTELGAGRATGTGLGGRGGRRLFLPHLT